MTLGDIFILSNCARVLLQLNNFFLSSDGAVRVAFDVHVRDAGSAVGACLSLLGARQRVDRTAEATPGIP